MKKSQFYMPKEEMVKLILAAMIILLLAFGIVMLLKAFYSQDEDVSKNSFKQLVDLIGIMKDGDVIKSTTLDLRGSYAIVDTIGEVSFSKYVTEPVACKTKDCLCFGSSRVFAVDTPSGFYDISNIARNIKFDSLECVYEFGVIGKDKHSFNFYNDKRDFVYIRRTSDIDEKKFVEIAIRRDGGNIIFCTKDKDDTCMKAYNEVESIKMFSELNKVFLNDPKILTNKCFFNLKLDQEIADLGSDKAKINELVKDKVYRSDYKCTEGEIKNRVRGTFYLKIINGTVLLLDKNNAAFKKELGTFGGQFAFIDKNSNFDLNPKEIIINEKEIVQVFDIGLGKLVLMVKLDKSVKQD